MNKLYLNTENFRFYDKAMLTVSGIECQEIIENNNITQLFCNLGYLTTKSKMWKGEPDITSYNMQGQQVYHVNVLDCINQREIHEIDITISGVLNKVLNQIHQNYANNTDSELIINYLNKKAIR